MKERSSNHDEATRLARQCLDAISDESYVERFADLVHREFVWENTVSCQKVHGPGGWVQYTAGWLAAFPGMQAELLRSEPTEAGALIHVRWDGAFTGTMMTPDGNIPGNGKRLVLESAIAVGTKEGKIVSWTHAQDPAEILAKLGLT